MNHFKAREFVEGVVQKMKPGEYVRMARDVFEAAYACGWPSIYDTHRQAFLSSQIGSGWGTVTCEAPDYVRHHDTYLIGKHEEGPRRVYVDPDREHLFTKTPSGEYVPRARQTAPTAAEPAERP